MEKNTLFNIIEDFLTKKDKAILDRLCICYVYDIYGNCKASEKILSLLIKALDLKKLDLREKAFLNFVIAEHRRISKNDTLFNENISQIKRIAIELSKLWTLNNKDIFNENDDRVNTSTLGMIYGSLFTTNNYLKEESISLQIKDMKNFAYKNNTTAGILMNGNKNKAISLDILFSVIPFGLFSPEDLVLVEAVKKMELMESTDDSIFCLTLAWYFAEKGDYKKARYYLKLSNNKEHMGIKELCLYLLVIKKLESCNQISENFIIHKPYGNYNRYAPLIEERFPKKPEEGEIVTINALTWPSDGNMSIYLIYKVNGKEQERIKGNFINSEESDFWQWKIGPFKKYSSIVYQIYFEKDEICKSEEYSFEVLGKNFFKEIKKIYRRENQVILYAIDMERGEERYLNIEINKLENFNISFLNREEVRTININNDCKEIFGDDIKLLTNNYMMVIDRNTMAFKIYKEDEIILETTHNQWLYWYEDKRGNIEKLSLDFLSKPQEYYYGFGERYNSINQRGNIVDVYVYNQYKDQGIKTYMPVPYFISNEGYGMYVNNNFYTTFDMCSTKKESYCITIENNSINLNIILGCPQKIIKKFCSISGTPAMIPKWALGPWMSSNNWDSDYEVRKQVGLTKKYDIPATVLVIEAWSDEATYYIFNDAIYDENDGSPYLKYSDFKFPKWGRWPDPKGLVKYLHENNIKCILWQIPIIKYMNGLHHLQKDADEEYMIKNKYCVQKEDGTAYRMPEGWFKDSLLMDFSNESGSEWWFNKRKYLTEEIGVDGFKTDGGEFVFGEKIKFTDGKTGKEMRNLYPNQYIESYFNFINKADRSGITFSRAGFAGAQKFPAHWAGDEKSNFGAFKRSIIAGLNSSMSGIVFWGWDLAGFSGEIPTAELFIRSTQMAAFCPIMQYHAESKAEFNQDRTPWNICKRTGEEKALTLYRYFANVRMNLIPYIYDEALKCCIASKPLMSPLFVSYPNDKNCLDIEDEYLFGEKLLIAPVIYEGASTREVYLPEGNWRDFWDSKIYKGGTYIKVEAPIDKIPVFVKENSIIPFNLNENFKIGEGISNNLECYDKLCFKVYGSKIEDFQFSDDMGNIIVFEITDTKALNINIKGNIEELYIIFDKEFFITDYLEVEDFRIEYFLEKNIIKVSKN